MRFLCYAERIFCHLEKCVREVEDSQRNEVLVVGYVEILLKVV